MSADYSDPRNAKVRTHSERENKCRYIIECCGISGICNVFSECRSPIPHIHLKDMLEELSSSILDSERQGMHTEVRDVSWSECEVFIRAIILDKRGQSRTI